MLFNFLVSCTLFLSFVVGAVANISCPPTTSPILITIYSQFDADNLSGCDTINGTLTIALDALQSLALNGPRNIIGDVVFDLGGSGPPPSIISFENLVSVSGTIATAGSASQSMGSDAITFDFPVLTSVGGAINLADVGGLKTLNLPALEIVGDIHLANLASMNALSLPRLMTAGSIDLSNLPSLQTASFGNQSSFQDLAGYDNRRSISVQNTALRSLSGLTFPEATDITITGNGNLTSLEMDVGIVQQTSAQYAFYSTVTIEDNGDDLALSFPNLKQINGSLAISGVSSISIPVLEAISDSLAVGEAGQVVIDHPLTTNLTTFSAPKLREVANSIVFNSSPHLFKISFPVLQRTSRIDIQNTLAQNMSGGIDFPNLAYVFMFAIEGPETYCAPFDNLRCRGVITNQYVCGANVAFSPSQIPVLGDAGSCDAEYPIDGSWPRSKKLVIGLTVGLGGGLLVGFIVGAAIYFLRRRRDKKVNAVVSRWHRSWEKLETAKAEMDETDNPKVMFYYQKHDAPAKVWRAGVTRYS